MAAVFSWEVGGDPATGRTFFVHRPTGASQWDVPADLRGACNALGWDLDLDPGSGRAFFADLASGAAAWEVPPALAPLSPGLSDDVAALADWAVETDDASGRPFFVQRSTGQSQWDVPAALQAGAAALGWAVELDPSTGRAYFTHDDSGTTQWEMPFALLGLSAPDAPGPDGQPSSRPSSRGTSRGSRPASRGSRPAGSRPPSGKSGASSRPGSRGSSRRGGRRRSSAAAGGGGANGSVWQENKDSSGSVFWFNAQTGEVTMVKPKELRTAADDAADAKAELERLRAEAIERGEDPDDDPALALPEDPAVTAAEAAKGASGGAGVEPEHRSKEHWADSREVSRLESVWGRWEVWRDPHFDDRRYWYNTKTEETTLEDPLALSSSDEEYMSSAAEDDAVGWTELKQALVREKNGESKADGGEGERETEGKEQQHVEGKEGREGKEGKDATSDGSSGGEDSDDDGNGGASSDGEDDNDDDDDGNDNDNDSVGAGKEQASSEGKVDPGATTAAGAGRGGRHKRAGKRRRNRGKKRKQSGEGKEEAIVPLVTEMDLDEETQHMLRARRGMCRAEWEERVRRRQTEKIELRERLGDKRPKPTRQDLRVNACLRHPLGFLSLTDLGYDEMPRRPIRQAKAFVKHLSLQENGLRYVGESDIEKRLAACPGLEALNFRQNLLTRLPDNFGLLTGLRALSVANNQIKELPLSVFLCTALTSLSLAHNHFNIMPSELGVKVMRKYRVWEMGWGNLTQLTSLDLSANKFDQLPTHLEGSQRDAQFGNLWSLTHLDMSENFFEDLPDEFFHLNSLTNLSVADNRMRGELSTDFGKLDALMHLDLANNMVSGLGSGLCTLRYLTRLQLRNNKLSSLPDNFGGMVGLTELDMAYNEIEEIPRSVGELTSLARLDLGRNRIEKTPASLGDLKSLSRLALSHNRITHVGGDLGRLLNLRELRLDHNHLAAPSALWGGGSLHKLQALELLDLSFNEISELPGSMFTPRPPPRLKCLDVQHNALTGLPPQVWLATTLTSLQISNNKLPALSDEIGDLVQLTTFGCARNELTALPETMAALRQLAGTIDLSCNAFTERPDAVLWRLPGIQHVIMGGCPLTPEGVSITQSLINGDLARMRGDLEGAVEYYSLVIEQEPLHFEAVQKRAKLNRELGHYEEAIEDITAAMRTRFDDASLFYARGELRLLVDPPRPQEALLDYRSALHRNEVFWAAMVGEARALIEIGQYQNAIDQCKVVIEADLEPSMVKAATYVTGVAEFKRGDSWAAIEIFDPMLDPELGPLPANEYEVTLMRGLCRRDLGETKDAIEDFTVVIVAYDEAREEEAERARIAEERRLKAEENGEGSAGGSSSGSGTDSDGDGEGKEGAGEKKEGGDGGEGDSGSDSGSSDEGNEEEFDEEENRIPVTEEQLITALMNRSGAYSTMGSKKNSTADYERVHGRKTDWKLIRQYEARVERLEAEKEAKEAAEEAARELEDAVTAGGSRNQLEDGPPRK